MGTGGAYAARELGKGSCNRELHCKCKLRVQIYVDATAVHISLMQGNKIYQW